MRRFFISTHGRYATITALVVLCAAFFVGIPTTSAQIAPLGSEPQIEITPRYPRAGEAFTAKLHIYSATVTGVSWTVDGEAVEGVGSELSLTAPATPGESMRITARAETNGVPVTLSQMVSPVEVDIIIEADTLAPYFYQGRRVPGPGAPTHISVVPHLFETNGAHTDTESLTYTWSVNNVIAAEGKGLNRFILDAQTVSEAAVRLRIESAEGRIRYEATFGIPRAEPVAVFYPVSPLLGLSRNAIQDSYLEADSEATVRVEPYGIDKNVFANAQYAWSIGDTQVANQSSDPQLITLRGTGGASDVGFSIRNLAALSQYAAGLFRINFN